MSSQATVHTMPAIAIPRLALWHVSHLVERDDPIDDAEQSQKWDYAQTSQNEGRDRGAALLELRRAIGGIRNRPVNSRAVFRTAGRRTGSSGRVADS